MNICFQQLAKVLEKYGQSTDTVGVFEWKEPGILRNLVFLILQCFMYFAIVLFLESDIFRRFKQKLVSSALSKRQVHDMFSILFTSIAGFALILSINLY